MTHHRLRAALLVGLVAATSTVRGEDGPPALPEIDGVEAVASVNGEPISLDDYLQALGNVHSEAMEPSVAISRRDPMALLDRLINGRLLLQEARTIGLDELPQFRGPVESFADELRRSALIRRAAEKTPPVEPGEIEERYRELATEVELASVLFETGEQAEAFRSALGQGDRGFAELAEERVAERLAREFGGRDFTRRNALTPGVREAIEGLEPGRVSEPVPLAGGVAVIKFYASRLADDPEARKEAERQLASEKRSRTVRAYVDELMEKNLEFDQELIDSIDFEADVDAYKRFLEDDRVLVRVEGGDPVRVRDLAEALQGRMFHGVDRAARNKRLNRSKDNVLEELITERVVQDEAKRLGLDDTPEFHAALRELEDEILFGLLVSRVIDPSVEVSDEEIAEFYEANIADYLNPEMLRLRSIVFADARTAQDALEHLNAGADLAWMRANAGGQVSADDVPPEMRFDGRLLAISSLPVGVVDAIAGAKTGSYRLFAETDDRHHVLYVEERHEPAPSPLVSVRDAVAGRVFVAKRQASVDEFTDRLREASEIDVFVSSEQLRRLLSDPDRES